MRKKQHKIPTKFEQNFLAKLDGRYELAKELKSCYAELTDDLGGVEGLSNVKKSLCERFVWLESIMRSIEIQIAESKQREAAELLGKWIQAVNSLTGIGRSLGLERKIRKVESLEGYVQSKVIRPKVKKRRRT